MKSTKQESTKRREKTLQVIKTLGVDYCEGLPLIGEEHLCKSKDQVCKRFLAGFFSAMLACDYNSDRDFFENEGRKIICSFLEQFNVKSELYPDELKIITGECDERTAVNVSWNVECSYALMWALGFISSEEMEEPSNGCDTCMMVKFVQQFNTFDEIMSACKMHYQSEVLDMFDIYYNFHWVCVDKRINPSTNCGNLNEEVVMERRKALEWLISEEQDWNEISLDT